MHSQKRIVVDDRLAEYQQSYLSPIEDIIDDARNGKMFILVDDEDRENEGDLIIPAQFATPEAINFMAKQGRGLICLAMETSMADNLGLELIGGRNCSQSTAFTISIEAKTGVTTGISASDRSKTIQTAIAENATAHDLSTPGHVFPLKAREGGVLVRMGHTEAAVDISRLAGVRHAGVICEIMKDDGEMARLPELVEFAKTHDLKIGTIADLVSYRRQNEQFIIRTEETEEKFNNDKVKCYIYKDTLSNVEHVAIIKGNIKNTSDIHVRIHHLNILSDVLKISESKLDDGMKSVFNNENGIFLLIKNDQINSIKSYKNNKKEEKNIILKDYAVAAQILKDLNVEKMIAHSNSNFITAALSSYGLTLTEQISI